MALEGSLQDMSLIDLIQIFRMGPKTGVLLLSRDVERGIVYVAEGSLVDAVLVEGPDRTVLAVGEEAVIQLLQWEDAQFIFRHDLDVYGREVRIHHDSDWLILEGVRRREQPLMGLAQPITLETRLALAALPSSSESGVNLDLEQWRILSQVAICQNLGEICRRSNIAPAKAIRTVTELIAIGLVEIVPTPPAVSRRPASQEYKPKTFQQVLVNVGAETSNAGGAAPGRNLVNAIMRRIRGL